MELNPVHVVLGELQTVLAMARTYNSWPHTTPPVGTLPILPTSETDGSSLPLHLAAPSGSSLELLSAHAPQQFSALAAPRGTARQRSSPTAGRDALLLASANLRRLLDACDSLDSLDVLEYLDPFLLVVRSEDTSGPVTGAALDSLRKFARSFIHDDSRSASAAMAQIASAVTHCKFEATDPDSDEVVLMKILQVLLACVEGPAGRLLSDTALVAMIMTCFRMTLQKRLSELLRKTAENSLQQLVLVVFSRYGAFDEDRARKEDAIDSANAAAAEAAAADTAEGQAVAVAAPRAEIRPYGARCLRSLFSFLCDLADSSSRDARALGLLLLTGLVERQGRTLQTFPSILILIRERVCGALGGSLLGDDLTVLSMSLRLIFNLYVEMKNELKVELGVLFHAMIQRVAAPAESTPEEVLELILEALAELCQQSLFAVDLYVNYDCDLHSPNLLADLASAIQHAAFPANQKLRTTHLLALECALAITNAMLNRTQAKAAAPQDGATDSDDGADDDDGDVVVTAKQLQHCKQTKEALLEAAEAFNSSADAGLSRLAQCGVLRMDWTAEPAAVAALLRTLPRLSKSVIGELIGKNKEFNIAVLTAYIESFAPVMAKDGFMLSIRSLMESFRVPGEAQVIARVLEIFAKVYKQHGKDADSFADEDAVYVLAYSIVLLNVDQHNPKVKVPMKLDDFRRQVRGVNGGNDFDIALVEGIYENIKGDEMHIPEETEVSQLAKFSKGSWAPSSSSTLGPTAVVASQLSDFPEDEACSHQCLAKLSSPVWRDLRRVYANAAPFLPTDGGAARYDAALFQVVWRPCLAALGSLYDAASDALVATRILEAFHAVARLAYQYSLSEVFDAVVIALAHFSLLLNAPGGRPEVVYSQMGAFGGNRKAQLASMTLFAVGIPMHRALVEGWRHLVTCAVHAVAFLAMDAEGVRRVSRTIEYPTVWDWVRPAALPATGHHHVAPPLRRRRATTDPAKASSSGLFSFWFGSSSSADAVLEAQRATGRRRRRSRGPTASVGAVPSASADGGLSANRGPADESTAVEEEDDLDFSNDDGYETDEDSPNASGPFVFVPQPKIVRASDLSDEADPAFDEALRGSDPASRIRIALSTLRSCDPTRLFSDTKDLSDDCLLYVLRALVLVGEESLEFERERASAHGAARKDGGGGAATNASASTSGSGISHAPRARSPSGSGRGSPAPGGDGALASPEAVAEGVFSSGADTPHQGFDQPAVFCLRTIMCVAFDNLDRAHLFYALLAEFLHSVLATSRVASPSTCEALTALLSFSSHLVVHQSFAERAFICLAGLANLADAVEASLSIRIAVGVMVVLSRAGHGGAARGGWASPAGWESVLSVAQLGTKQRSSGYYVVPSLRLGAPPAAPASLAHLTPETVRYFLAVASECTLSTNVAAHSSRRAIEFLYQVFAHALDVCRVRDAVASIPTAGADAPIVRGSHAAAAFTSAWSQSQPCRVFYPDAATVSDEAYPDPWRLVWKPVLLTLVVAMADLRSSVRNCAAMVLQRSLLHADLNVVGEERWVGIFDGILFPLSDAAISDDVSPDESDDPFAAYAGFVTSGRLGLKHEDFCRLADTAVDGGSHDGQSNVSMASAALNMIANSIAPMPKRVGGDKGVQQGSSRGSQVGEASDKLLDAASRSGHPVEEARLRVASLLCKAWLHFACRVQPSYTQSDSFQTCWVQLLHTMEALARAGNSELLRDAIPESLRNVVHVMHAAGLLHEAGTLYKVTKDFLTASSVVGNGQRFPMFFPANQPSATRQAQAASAQPVAPPAVTAAPVAQPEQPSSVDTRSVPEAVPEQAPSPHPFDEQPPPSVVLQL